MLAVQILAKAPMNYLFSHTFYNTFASLANNSYCTWILTCKHLTYTHFHKSSLTIYYDSFMKRILSLY